MRKLLALVNGTNDREAYLKNISLIIMSFINFIYVILLLLSFVFVL